MSGKGRQEFLRGLSGRLNESTHDSAHVVSMTAVAPREDFEQGTTAHDKINKLTWLISRSCGLQAAAAPKGEAYG